MRKSSLPFLLAFSSSQDGLCDEIRCTDAPGMMYDDILCISDLASLRGMRLALIVESTVSIKVLGTCSLYMSSIQLSCGQGGTQQKNRYRFPSKEWIDLKSE